MKIGKRAVISVGALAATALGVSTAAMAYVPRDYCAKLGNSWGDWLDWIAMCI